MESKLKDYRQYKKRVQKIEQFQEEANSSGDEDFKLVKKYQNYEYKKVKFASKSLTRIGMKNQKQYETVSSLSGEMP